MAKIISCRFDSTKLPSMWNLSRNFWFWAIFNHVSLLFTTPAYIRQLAIIGSMSFLFAFVADIRLWAVFRHVTFLLALEAFVRLSSGAVTGKMAFLSTFSTASAVFTRLARAGTFSGHMSLLPTFEAAFFLAPPISSIIIITPTSHFCRSLKVLFQAV